MLRHRRPELYAEVMKPRDDLYDFFYFRNIESDASSSPDHL
jgi:hypothetical protein